MMKSLLSKLVWFRVLRKGFFFCFCQVQMTFWRITLSLRISWDSIYCSSEARVRRPRRELVEVARNLSTHSHRAEAAVISSMARFLYTRIQRTVYARDRPMLLLSLFYAFNVSVLDGIQPLFVLLFSRFINSNVLDIW
jgi:hypothetical protein